MSLSEVLLIAVGGGELNKRRKSPATAILRNQEARGNISQARRQDVPTAKTGQRTILSGLEQPQQDRQLSWCAQTGGFRSPYGTNQGDLSKSPVVGPAGAVHNLSTKLDGRLSQSQSSDQESISAECRPPGAAILGLTDPPRCRPQTAVS